MAEYGCFIALSRTREPQYYAKGAKIMNSPRTVSLLLLTILLLSLPLSAVAADSHAYKKPEDVVA
jgi:hypothetical protein